MIFKNYMITCQVFMDISLFLFVYTYMVSQEHRKIAVEGISPNQFFPFSWFFKYTNPDQSSMLMTSRHALRCTWPVLLLVLGLGMLGCISAMACPILYQEMFAALSLKITSMFKGEVGVNVI